MSISAVLIVGLEYDQFDPEHIDNALDMGELDSASPYYDAAREDCIFGITVVGDYSGAIDLEVLNDDIKDAHREFKELTGLDGKIFVAPNVT